jgi:hypothetical protein
LQSCDTGNLATNYPLFLNPNGGNVGIGSTSAAGQLDLFGSGSSGTLNGLFVRGIPRLTNDTGTFENTYIGAGASVGNIIFQRGNSTTTSSNSESARFDASGNFLVGKTSGSTTVRGISINGTGSATFVDSQTGDGPQIQVANIWSSVLNGFRFLSFRINASANEVGSISTNGSSTTSYNTSSDYRLKENVQPMQNALAKVAALKPCTYTWKADGSNGEGFIAHELAEVCPQAVTGVKDAVDEEGNPKHQGVDTSFLVATLTAAIQELNAKVTLLEQQVLNLGVK